MKQFLLLVWISIFAYGLQAMEKKGVVDSFKELTEVNENLYRIIDEENKKAQLSMLCQLLPGSVQLTDQGKMRCEKLQELSVPANEENQIEPQQNCHRKLTEQNVDFFDSIKNAAKEEFKISILGKNTKVSNDQYFKGTVDDLWEIYRSLPGYRDLYLCEDKEVESILLKHRILFDLTEEETKTFVSEQPFATRRKNFVIKFHGYHQLRQKLLEMLKIVNS